MKKILFSLCLPIAALAIAVPTPVNTLLNITPTTFNPDGYIVYPGGHLRMSDNNNTVPFDFATGGIIKVMTGGQLSIFSGVLTCTSGTWTGIEVDAEATSPLTNPGTYPVYVGNHKHGVVIENADIGINCLPTTTGGQVAYAADLYLATYSVSPNGSGDYGLIFNNADVDVQFNNIPTTNNTNGATNYVPNETVSFTSFNGQSTASHHNLRSSANIGFNIINTEFLEDPFVKVWSQGCKYGFAMEESLVRISQSTFYNEYTAVRSNNTSILDFDNNRVSSTDYGIVSFNTLLSSIQNSTFNYISEHAVHGAESENIRVMNNTFWYCHGNHTNYVNNSQYATFWKNQYIFEITQRPQGTPVGPNYFTAIKSENNAETSIRQNTFDNYPFSYIDIYNSASPALTTICRNTFNSASTTFPLAGAAIMIDGALIQDQGTTVSGANNTFNLLPTYWRVINNNATVMFHNQPPGIANEAINDGMSINADHEYVSPNELCPLIPRMAQNDHIEEELEETEITDNLVIYPNPTHSVVNIENLAEGATVEVYNSIGKRVINVRNVNTIDLSDYPNGLYLMRVISEDKIVGVQKIVKN